MPTAVGLPGSCWGHFTLQASFLFPLCNVWRRPSQGAVAAPVEAFHLADCCPLNMDLMKAALPQALTSKEGVARIMGKARKYQAQLEERKLLQQLVAGLVAGQQDSLRRFKDLLKVGSSRQLRNANLFGHALSQTTNCF